METFPEKTYSYGAIDANKELVMGRQSEVGGPEALHHQLGCDAPAGIGRGLLYREIGQVGLGT